VPAPENVELLFPDGGCFGCSQSNPRGLHLRFERRGGAIHATATIADHFHGAPGVAHGGIVATLLDEISCAAVHFLRDRWVVTGELGVRYEHPVPVAAPLALRARIVDETHARYAAVEGIVERDGATLARSTGKFFYQGRAEAAP
jgi:acyl-coenzyme A thioesterase PaaI-like protein